MRRLAVRGLGVLAMVLLAASCATSGLAFEKDEQIRIVAPRALETVKPPFVMRWTGHAAGASAYEVFVDRAPMAPNQSLREYAASQCEGTALCPADGRAALDAWLAQRGIFKAGQSKLRVPFVTTRGPSTEKDTREIHEAIVVALGPDGRRLGESAWAVNFRVPAQQFGA
jgi:hypothetical protein